MAQKRIYELAEDTAPTTDHSLALDKSGNAAATRVTLANLLQKLRVGLQSYGGNARGTAAVDLQVSRAADNQVASGNAAVICGGERNRASASRSAALSGYTNLSSGIGAVVSGGYSNTASGNQSMVGGGQNNVAQAVQSAVGGGYGNAATGLYSTVGGGYGNTASGAFSVAPGGYSNVTSGGYAHAIGLFAFANKEGQSVHASGRFAANGDAQHGWMVARRAITSHTNTTWYDLFLNGSSLKITIPADTLWQFRVMVIGLTSGAAQRWAYRIEGAIVNDGGSTSLVGSPSVTVISESDAAYDCQAVADDTNDALGIQVQRNGGSDYSVRWMASVEVVEVAFP